MNSLAASRSCPDRLHATAQLNGTVRTIESCPRVKATRAPSCCRQGTPAAILSLGSYL